MTNYDRYVKVFTSTFEVEPDVLKTLKYQDIENWDSIGHMGLIAALEDEFGIMMDTDDIIDFSSFEKGIEILAKYNITM